MGSRTKDEGTRPVAYISLTSIVDQRGYHTVTLAHGKVGGATEDRCTSEPAPPGEAASHVRTMAETFARALEDLQLNPRKNR